MEGMRELDEVRSDIIRNLTNVKSEMEKAGVSSTSEGNMSVDDFSRLKERVQSELEPLSRELGQMLDGQGKSQGNKKVSG